MYRVSFSFAESVPTDLACHTWRVVDDKTPSDAALHAAILDGIFTMGRDRVWALVRRDNSKYVHAFQLRLKNTLAAEATV